MTEKPINVDNLSGKQKISLLRKALKKHNYFKFKEHGHIDTMDMYSASAIIAVYDAVNESNKERLANQSFKGMSEISFRVLNEHEKKKKLKETGV